MWRLNKFQNGKFIAHIWKKKNGYEIRRYKTMRHHDMRVFTIFSCCSLYILIYYFHFNEQYTSILSMRRWVFWWLRWWWCVCSQETRINWKWGNIFLSLFEYDKYADEINHMHATLLRIGKLATIILHFKIKYLACTVVCETKSRRLNAFQAKRASQPTQKFVLCSKMWSFCKNIFRSRLHLLRVFFLHSFY